jgi:hypothetical protein
MTKRDDLQQRYLVAAHAVQAGVAMEMNDVPPTYQAVLFRQKCSELA